MSIITLADTYRKLYVYPMPKACIDLYTLTVVTWDHSLVALPPPLC